MITSIELPGDLKPDEILALLYSLAQKPIQNYNLFLSPQYLKRPESFKALIQINICFYAFLNECYQQPDFEINIEFHLLNSEDIPSPTKIYFDGESTPQAQIQNWIENGRGHSYIDLKQAFQLIDNCAKQWLQVSEEHWESNWQSEAGQIYRTLQDMQLWRYGLLGHTSDILNTIRQDIFNHPNHPSYYLSLLLYKRWYGQIQHLPDKNRAIIEYYRQRNGAHLEILDAPKSYEITVIILTYNRLEKLKISLECILKQSHQAQQIIIADGGSNDGTRAYVEQLQKSESSIYYLFRDLPPGSQSIRDMWSLACDTSQTELVVLVPDDDQILPNCLEKSIQFFQSHPWVSMVAGGYYLVETREKQEIKRTQFGPYYASDTIANPQLELQRSAFFNPIYGGGVIYRKSLLKAWAPFESEESQYTGWDWLITGLALQKYEVGFVQDILALYFIDNQNQESFTTDFWIQKGPDLIRYIITGYESLVGPNSYPEYCLEYYEKHMSLGKRYGEAIYQLIKHESRSDSFKTQSNHLIDLWGKWLNFKQQFQSVQSPMRDTCVFEHQMSHAMGLTQGKSSNE